MRIILLALCLASCAGMQSASPADKCETTARRVDMVAGWAGAVCLMSRASAADCGKAQRYADASAAAAAAVCAFLPRSI
mgnify:FL=1